MKINKSNVIFIGYKQIHRSDSIGWLVLFTSVLLLTILSAGRLTLVGQFLDDVIFTFLFGLFKYAIYALLIVICGLGFAKLRIHTNPKVLLIIGCSFIIITTFISNVLLIYDYVNKTDRTIKVFSPQIFVIVMRHFINSWYNNSIFGAQYLSNLSFFQFNGEWFAVSSSGGIFGEFICAVFSYLTIFAPFILATIAFVLMISWLITGHVLGIFMSKGLWSRLQIIRVTPSGKVRQFPTYVQKRQINKPDSEEFAMKQVNLNYDKPGILMDDPSPPPIINSAPVNPTPLTEEPDTTNNTFVTPEADIPTAVPVNANPPVTAEAQSDDHSIQDLADEYHSSSGKPVPKPVNIDNQQEYIIPESYKKRQKQIDPEAMSKARARILSNSKITPFAAHLKTVESQAQIEDSEPENTTSVTQEIAEDAPEVPADDVSITNKHEELSLNADVNDTVEHTGDEDTKVEPQKPKAMAPNIEDYLKNQASKFDFLNQLRKAPADKASESSSIKTVADSAGEEAGLENALETNNVTMESYEKAVYLLPALNLLKSYHEKAQDREINREHADQKANVICNNFDLFSVKATVAGYHIGPAVTKFEIKIMPGVKVKSVLELEKDLKLALATKMLRIEYPMPGKSSIGFEIPNKKRSVVGISELLNNVPSELSRSPLLVALGKGVNDDNIFVELDKAPHMLIAGSTGSGKSVCINSILISLIMRTKPDQVKLLLIDPKRVELNVYNGLPHLLAPVISKATEAHEALQRVVGIMHDRYSIFAQANKRSLAEFNRSVPSQKRLPYIVIIIDELADLMNVLGREVESSIQQITQMARAAGIHMVVATQRPSTNIITGVIKTNIPLRIAFSVANGIDSRTILDATGAEKLLGRGDMLYQTIEQNIPHRAQGAYVDFDEIMRIIKYTKKEQTVKYSPLFANLDSSISEAAETDDDSEQDILYEDIKAYIIANKRASTSLLQRKFKIGYNRASRIIDDLEEEGVIGPQNGSKPREVYGS